MKNNPVIYQDPTGHWAERPHNGGWGSCFDTFGCTEMAHRGNPTGGTCGDDCAFVFGANGVAQEYSISAQEAEGEKGAAVLQVVVAVAYEPADWAMTGYAWSQGDFHVTDLLGLLPFVPAAAARFARGADNVSDVARYADDAVGAFCSFSEDTLVSTEEGFVPISEVELDDYVLAYNEETGEIGYYPVVAIWAHEDPVIVYLTIEGETIVTTPEHPFYTAEGEWVPAADLQPGVEIRSAEWGSGTVEKVGFSLRPRVMYNFTVAEAHTYFVGVGQSLVHNDCWAHKIANGHAYDDHLDDFMGLGIKTRDQLAEHLVDVETFGVTRELGNGRFAYWLDEGYGDGWGTVMIVDPSNVDGGTAVRRADAEEYFDSLN